MDWGERLKFLIKSRNRKISKKSDSRSRSRAGFVNTSSYSMRFWIVQNQQKAENPTPDPEAYQLFISRLRYIQIPEDDSFSS